jgi:hypothetical protein
MYLGARIEGFGEAKPNMEFKFQSVWEVVGDRNSSWDN